MRYSKTLDGENEGLALEKPEIVPASEALVTIRPRIDVILDDAAEVLHAEIIRMGKKAKGHAGLNEKEIRS